MNSREVILKFQDKSNYDYCCSESIFYAANEYFELSLDDNTFRVSSSFCGGNHVEGTCGLLTSSIAILAIIFADDVAHKCPNLNQYINDYSDLFEATFNNSNCLELKKVYRSETFGCKELIVENFVLLCNYIDNIKK